MATLKTNTLTGTSTAGSIAVTGEGNSTTTNLQQGLLKCWCSLNGTGTIAMHDSFNSSTNTDHGTGAYTINITNDMASANGKTPLLSIHNASDTSGTGVIDSTRGIDIYMNNAAPSASTLRVQCAFGSNGSANGADSDSAGVHIGIAGDLA